MPTTIGFLSVTGSAQNIARVQDMYNRITTNLDPYVTGTLDVLFTGTLPKHRYPNGRVHSVRGYSDKDIKRIRVRHNAPDAPDLLPEETKYVILHEIFHFIDWHWLKRSNRAAIMALMSPGVGSYPAGETYRRWRSDKKGYFWKPYENYCDNAVDAYSDIADPRVNRYERNVSDLAALRTAIQASGSTDDDTGDGDGEPGDDDDNDTGYQPSYGTYRPVFVSQFDDPGAPSGEESKNCLHAAGAMLLDRHTMGTKRKTAHQIRVASGDAPRTASSMSDLKKAWAHFGETLTTSKTDSWTTVMQKVANGQAAVVGVDFNKIPRRWTCSTPIRVGHALYINEVAADGDILVFDPVCRPSDRQGAGKSDMLDPQYATQTTEDQPHWIPQNIIMEAARSFNRGRSGVSVAYSRKTQGGAGYGGPAGDVFAVGVSDDGYEDFTQAPASPGDPGIVQRRWKAGTQHAGLMFQTNGNLTLMDPEVVITGEEGMLSRWNPTADGYGIKGRSFYKTPAGWQPGDNGQAFKAGRRHWFLHPWDIPTDHFWVDPPDWPEGREYGLDLIERANLSYGRQALNVVNRANLWAEIELGTLITIDLGLTGPHPDGTTGTVRVVGYSPDEESGQMQLLCEWVE